MRIRRETGLTWEQLGRLFGVSRRAVHLWAGGARLNARNEQVVREFAALVDALDAANPEERRAALFAPRPVGGLSLVDEFRARHAPGSGEVTGRPFHPADLLGNLHGDASRP
ncbi:hypothetical protein [Kineococcus gypseus]|uniref:hypothetical protein n=1 Tax=Kineococcus gypseus TaxID=1637102 RepID=UPI003D7E6DFF